MITIIHREIKDNIIPYISERKKGAREGRVVRDTHVQVHTQIL